ncbi:MAG TPA: HAD-IC family P-type ATPase [Thermoanaerobaculia bacterium]|nr:HAD-IC family P-type ATPase [Thermoanaerobaculia bacterium]
MTTHQERIAWHTLPIEEVASRLDAARDGLTDAEAERRLARYGPNEVEAEKETPAWRLFLHQFQDPLIYILLVAAVVTLVLREFIDSGVILFTVLVNSVIGFAQELRAQHEMRALTRLSAAKAEALREGRQQTIPSRELVPGDVVLLASGSRVPADLRLTVARDFEVDESALTGESVPVRKDTGPLSKEFLVPGDQLNVAFAGTIVTRGRGRGYVIRTGLATELGQIALAVRRIGPTATPLQQHMMRFGRMVGLVIAVMAVVVVIEGLFRGTPPGEIFIVAVALAVSAIPEGLPVVLTITLAIGVRRMARRNAIIRSLPAVETLGSTSVIGSDKTGTLTKNEMTVKAIWAGGRRYEVTGGGYDPAGQIVRDDAAADRDDRALMETLRAGVHANEADALFDGRSSGDPTELALLTAAAKGGIAPAELRLQEPEVDVVPFEPDLRFMASLRQRGSERVIYMKGAPEAVLARCDRQLTDDGERDLDREAVESAAGAMAAVGLRVLAMALKPSAREKISEEDLSGGFLLAGLQGMEDPVRPEAVAAVADAKQAGIRTVMITGDHVATAAAIGRQLGLGDAETKAVSGAELEPMNDADLDQVVAKTSVFARVAPDHKLRIVKSLKRQDHIVAVTGDGVNDAPALRAAHIGIAMGRSGTDVAREASAMVLADDNFATITAAVEEGRVVFSNIRKVTFFLLSTAVGEVLAIMVSLGLGSPLPFVAAQILWINLVTNGVQDVALAFEPGEPGLLRRRPRPRKEGVLTLRLLERLGGVGIVLAAGTLAVFWWTLNRTDDLVLARTVAMTQMVVFQFFHVFNCRSLDRSIVKVPFFSNRFLFASVLAAAAAHLAVLYVPPLQIVFRTVPISAEYWVVIFAVATTVIFGGELDKWRNRRLGRPIG